MIDTIHLGLPLIAAAQAQKHVTHNEALVTLDALAQICVIDRDLSGPPVSPAEGDRYIVAASAGGAWTGHDGALALCLDGDWRFHTPRAGWVVYIVDEDVLAVHDGTAWRDVGTPDAASLALLGVGTTADVGNPLSVRANNTLFAARPVGEGGSGDIRIKLNKETAARTASFVFQDGYSGRAEFGLVGDDDFVLKVSADGSSWTDALRVGRAGGEVTLPALGPEPFAHGRCQLVKSGADLVLGPWDGDGLVIAGETRRLPPGGIALGPEGLAADTVYYVYAAWSGTSVTLEASTASHERDAASGIEVKAGDASRTLVGMARVVSGPAWADDATHRFVRTWFNRRPIGLSSSLDTALSVSGAALTEISVTLRLDYLAWAGECVDIAAAGSIAGSTEASATTAVAVDGISSMRTLTGIEADAPGGFALAAHVPDLAEGAHTVTLFGGASAGTAIWAAADTATSARTRLSVRLFG